MVILQLARAIHRIGIANPGRIGVFKAIGPVHARIQGAAQADGAHGRTNPLQIKILLLQKTLMRKFTVKLRAHSRKLPIKIDTQTFRQRAIVQVAPMPIPSMCPNC